MLVDKNIIRKDSEYYSKIRHYKDLYTYYIEALKFVYKDEWQKHIGINVLKSALNGKMSDEECNKRYSRDVANLLLTDCRYKKVLERVCSSNYTGEELEEGFKQPKSKSGDAKYESMRYWEYLPEYFYEYQKRYGCTFYLDYIEPEIKKTVESMYMSREFGVLTQNLQSEYRANMREAIADFLDDPVNKQVREQLYDDYKRYAHNCQIRTKTGNFIADTTWDKGKLQKDNIQKQDLYKYIMALNPYAFANNLYGILRVAHKTDQNEMENWGVALKDAKDLACLQGEKDLYMSPNLFKSINSYTKDDVSRLNALFVDLDFYKTAKYGRFDPKDMVGILKLLKFGGETGVPEPSLCIDTGRGLCLVWLIESMSVTDKSQKYWEWIEERLVEQFKDYGVDQAVKDTTRILRMLGSINSKSGKVVQVIEGDLDHPKRYFIDEIHKALDRVKEAKEALKSNKQLQEIPRNSAPNPSKTRKGEGFGLSVGNMHKMFLNRIHDLEQVVEYRRINGCNGIEETGWRDKLLFLHCLHNCYAGNTVDYAINKALELNKKLSIPLKERKLTSKKTTLTKAKNAYFRSIKNSKSYRVQNDGVYRYTTDKIIEMIELTEEEQANIEFLTLVSEEVRKERKKIKNAERYQAQLKAKGEKPKKDKKADMRKEIKKLLAQGMTQKAIAEKLGVSLRTIQYRVKEIREQKIIELPKAEKTEEDRSHTMEVVSVTQDKKEVYVDTIGMPSTRAVTDYRGFGEQTVG